MYIGHFAAGLAIQSRFRVVPLWILLIGIAFLDILFSIFIVFGIERISTKGFDFIDWSHSLVMSLVLSIGLALLFYKKGSKYMLAIGMAIFSHFVLDFISHAPDLALYPYSSIHMGLGLILSKWGWWIELGISFTLCAFYFQQFLPIRNLSIYAVSIALLLLSLHITRKILGL